MSQSQSSIAFTNLQKKNISDDLISELQSNLVDLDHFHQSALSTMDRQPPFKPVATLSESNRTHDLLRTRDSSSRTLAEIIDAASEGTPMSKPALQRLGDSTKKKSASHSRKICSRRTTNGNRSHWGVEDRKKLYNGLRLFGTDFSMISAVVLKNRTRKQVYKRFQREDRLKPELVTKALQWNSDNKGKLSAGFGRILKALNINMTTFNLLDPGTSGGGREDGIMPLEYYLTNPSFN